jgi:WhiB family redox-sensing transcriptional regulator
MSGRPRTNVHVVTYWRPRQSSADEIATAFAVAMAEQEELLGWMSDALCAEVGGDQWFPEAGEPTEPAKRVCRQCPVKAECLDYAVENKIRFGVWGGTSERERQGLRRRREAA